MSQRILQGTNVVEYDFRTNYIRSSIHHDNFYKNLNVLNWSRCLNEECSKLKLHNNVTKNICVYFYVCMYVWVCTRACIDFYVNIKNVYFPSCDL